MQVTEAATKQEAVQAVMNEVATALPNDVAHIRFHFDHDWSGDPAIYVRVLLFDSDGGYKAFHEIAQVVRQMLYQRLNFNEFGNLYIRFRSVAEQQELNDPSWA